MRDLREEVQGEGRPDQSHTLQPQGAAGYLRRLREDVLEQQLFVRAPEVRALQGEIRVSSVQEEDGDSGESERAHDQTAREERERGLRGMRQDVL